MHSVACSKCSAHRPPEVANMNPRPPCPMCGGTALTYSMSIEESVSVSDTPVAALIPGVQIRDWKQRWKLIEEEIIDIQRLHTENMSSQSIHAALQRLLAFFILAYHLKDALITAGASLGLTASVVETAVTKNANLALLADLANLDKHMHLNRPPRSGSTPNIDKISGIDCPGGWKLSVVIKHGALTLDGITLAGDMVHAWRTELKFWGLI